MAGYTIRFYRRPAQWWKAQKAVTAQIVIPPFELAAQSTFFDLSKISMITLEVSGTSHTIIGAFNFFCKRIVSQTSLSKLSFDMFW